MRLGEVDTVADLASRRVECQSIAIVDDSTHAWFACVEIPNQLPTELAIGWTSIPASGDGR